MELTPYNDITRTNNSITKNSFTNRQMKFENSPLSIVDLIKIVQNEYYVIRLFIQF